MRGHRRGVGHGGPGRLRGCRCRRCRRRPRGGVGRTGPRAHPAYRGATTSPTAVARDRGAAAVDLPPCRAADAGGPVWAPQRHERGRRDRTPEHPPTAVRPDPVPAHAGPDAASGGDPAAVRPALAPGRPGRGRGNPADSGRPAGPARRCPGPDPVRPQDEPVLRGKPVQCHVRHLFGRVVALASTDQSHWTRRIRVAWPVSAAHGRRNLSVEAISVTQAWEHGSSTPTPPERRPARRQGPTGSREKTRGEEADMSSTIATALGAWAPRSWPN
jgi:hypothetical protein